MIVSYARVDVQGENCPMRRLRYFSGVKVFCKGADNPKKGLVWRLSSSSTHYVHVSLIILLSLGSFFK